MGKEMNPVEAARKAAKKRATAKIKQLRHDNRQTALQAKPLHDLTADLTRAKAALQGDGENEQKKSVVKKLEVLIEQKREEAKQQQPPQPDKVVITGALGQLIKHNASSAETQQQQQQQRAVKAEPAAHKYEVIELIVIPPGLTNKPTPAHIPPQFRAVTHRPPPPPPNACNIAAHAPQRPHQPRPYPQHNQHDHIPTHVAQQARPEPYNNGRQQPHTGHHRPKRPSRGDTADPLNPTNFVDSDRTLTRVTQHNRDAALPIQSTVASATPPSLPPPPAAQPDNMPAKLQAASAEALKAAIMMPSNLRVKRQHINTYGDEHVAPKRAVNAAPSIA